MNQPPSVESSPLRVGPGCSGDHNAIFDLPRLPAQCIPITTAKPAPSSSLNVDPLSAFLLMSMAQSPDEAVCPLIVVHRSVPSTQRLSATTASRPSPADRADGGDQPAEASAAVTPEKAVSAPSSPSHLTSAASHVQHWSRGGGAEARTTPPSPTLAQDFATAAATPSIVRANPFAVRLLGYDDASSLVGRSFENMFCCYAMSSSKEKGEDGGGDGATSLSSGLKGLGGSSSSVLWSTGSGDRQPLVKFLTVPPPSLHDSAFAHAGSGVPPPSGLAPANAERILVPPAALGDGGGVGGSQAPLLLQDMVATTAVASASAAAATASAPTTTTSVAKGRASEVNNNNSHSDSTGLHRQSSSVNHVLPLAEAHSVETLFSDSSIKSLIVYSLATGRYYSALSLSRSSLEVPGHGGRGQLVRQEMFLFFLSQIGSAMMTGSPSTDCLAVPPSIPSRRPSDAPTPDGGLQTTPPSPSLPFTSASAVSTGATHVENDALNGYPHPLPATVSGSPLRSQSARRWWSRMRGGEDRRGVSPISHDHSGASSTVVTALGSLEERSARGKGETDASHAAPTAARLPFGTFANHSTQLAEFSEPQSLASIAPGRSTSAAVGRNGPSLLVPQSVPHMSWPAMSSTGLTTAAAASGGGGGGAVGANGGVTSPMGGPSTAATFATSLTAAAHGRPLQARAVGVDDMTKDALRSKIMYMNGVRHVSLAKDVPDTLMMNFVLFAMLTQATLRKMRDLGFTDMCCFINVFKKAYLAIDFVLPAEVKFLKKKVGSTRAARESILNSLQRAYLVEGSRQALHAAVVAARQEEQEQQLRQSFAADMTTLDELAGSADPMEKALSNRIRAVTSRPITDEQDQPVPLSSFLSEELIEQLVGCGAEIRLSMGNGASVRFPFITKERLALLHANPQVQLSAAKGLSVFGVAGANALTEQAMADADAPAAKIIPLRYDRAADDFNRFQASLSTQHGGVSSTSPTPSIAGRLKVGSSSVDTTSSRVTPSQSRASGSQPQVGEHMFLPAHVPRQEQHSIVTTASSSVTPLLQEEDAALPLRRQQQQQKQKEKESYGTSGLGPSGVPASSSPPLRPTRMPVTTSTSITPITVPQTTTATSAPPLLSDAGRVDCIDAVEEMEKKRHDNTFKLLTGTAVPQTAGQRSSPVSAATTPVPHVASTSLVEVTRTAPPRPLELAMMESPLDDIDFFSPSPQCVPSDGDDDEEEGTSDSVDVSLLSSLSAFEDDREAHKQPHQSPRSQRASRATGRRKKSNAEALEGSEDGSPAAVPPAVSKETTATTGVKATEATNVTQTGASGVGRGEQRTSAAGRPSSSSSPSQWRPSTSDPSFAEQAMCLPPLASAAGAGAALPSCGSTNCLQSNPNNNNTNNNTSSVRETSGTIVSTSADSGFPVVMTAMSETEGLPRVLEHVPARPASSPPIPLAGAKRKVGSGGLSGSSNAVMGVQRVTSSESISFLQPQSHSQLTVPSTKSLHMGSLPGVTATAGRPDTALPLSFIDESKPLPSFAPVTTVGGGGGDTGTDSGLISTLGYTATATSLFGHDPANANSASSIPYGRAMASTQADYDRLPHYGRDASLTVGGTTSTITGNAGSSLTPPPRRPQPARGQLGRPGLSPPTSVVPSSNSVLASTTGLPRTAGTPQSNSFLSHMDTPAGTISSSKVMPLFGGLNLNSSALDMLVGLSTAIPSDGTNGATESTPPGADAPAALAAAGAALLKSASTVQQRSVSLSSPHQWRLGSSTRLAVPTSISADPAVRLPTALIIADHGSSSAVPANMSPVTADNVTGGGTGTMLFNSYSPAGGLHELPMVWPTGEEADALAEKRTAAAATAARATAVAAALRQANATAASSNSLPAPPARPDRNNDSFAADSRFDMFSSTVSRGAEPVKGASTRGANNAHERNGSSDSTAGAAIWRRRLHLVVYNTEEREEIADALACFGHSVLFVTKPIQMERFLRAGAAAFDAVIVEWCAALVTPTIQELLLTRAASETVLMFHVTQKDPNGPCGDLPFPQTDAINEDAIVCSPDISTTAFNPVMLDRARVYIRRKRLLRDLLDVRLRHSYQIVRQVGSGGFGDVFEVLMYVSRGRLAMKRIFLKNVKLSVLEQLNREVMIMSALDHANIISFSHARLEENTYSIFMELGDCTLADRLRAPTETAGFARKDSAALRSQDESAIDPFASLGFQPGVHRSSLANSTAAALNNARHGSGSAEGPQGGGARAVLTSHEAILIIHDVASGLAYLHNKDIIHRDIKPENVLFAGGVAKIADFGSATQVSETLRLTNMRGTLSYMSPEVMLGEQYSKPCDIWSLGCLIADIIGLNLGHLSGLHVPAMVELFKSLSGDASLPITLTNRAATTNMTNYYTEKITQGVVAALQAAVSRASNERTRLNMTASTSNPKRDRVPDLGDSTCQASAPPLPHNPSLAQFESAAPSEAASSHGSHQPSSHATATTATTMHSQRRELLTLLPISGVVSAALSTADRGCGGAAAGGQSNGSISDLTATTTTTTAATSSMSVGQDERTGMPMMMLTNGHSYAGRQDLPLSPSQDISVGKAGMSSLKGGHRSGGMEGTDSQDYTASPHRPTQRNRTVTCIRTSSVSVLGTHTVQLPASLVELFEGIFCRDPTRRMTINDILNHPVTWDVEWMTMVRAEVDRVMTTWPRDGEEDSALAQEEADMMSLSFSSDRESSDGDGRGAEPQENNNATSFSLNSHPDDEDSPCE